MMAAIGMIVGVVVAGAGLYNIVRWIRHRARGTRPEGAPTPIIGVVQIFAGALVALGIWPYGSLLLLAVALAGVVGAEWNRALWGTATRAFPLLLVVVAVAVLSVGPERSSEEDLAETSSKREEDASPTAAQNPRGRRPVIVPRRAIVGVAPGGKGEARAAIARHGGKVVSVIQDGNAFVVETPGPPGTLLASLEDEPGIVYAEPDYIVTTSDVTPNDTRWSSQWGPRKIEAPLAWDTTRGSKTIVVGIIDSGVDYRHEDLAGRMWTNPGEIPGNGIDDDNNGWIDDVHGADCHNDDGDPMDDNDHGTHVAGTVGASTDNARGIAGVDWNVKIMALKFIGPDGAGKTSDAVQCIDYAIRMGAHLTNNSWGGAGFSRSLYDAIARARSAGQVFVAAAGNESQNLDVLPTYPASYDLDNIISVAASDSSDAPAAFSNFGMSVDIAAPGVGIISTTRNNTYSTWNGTSMAAPHVAGVATLVLSNNIQLTPAAVIKFMIDNADEVPLLAGTVANGKRLDAAGAVRASSPTPVSSPAPSPTPLLPVIPQATSTAPVVGEPAQTPTPTPTPTPSPEPQPSPSPTPPGPQEPSDRSYPPDAVIMRKGTSRGNPVANLESDDGRSYRISSRKVSAGKHVVDWFGTTVVEPGGTDLTVVYDGSYTKRTVQRLLLFDFSSNRWRGMSRATVRTSDRTFTLRPEDPSRYVSGQGHVRVRVRGAAKRSFTARADMMRFTIRA